jgi:hypothetical protein
MSNIRRLKPLFSQLKTADNDVFSWSGYWTRILLYGSVLVSLILPTYDFKLHGFHVDLSGRQKSKYSESRQYIAAINKGQQAYFIENGKFSNSIADLGLGIKTETFDYIYEIISANGPIQTPNDNTNMVPYFESVTIVSHPKEKYIPSYIGVVFAVKNNQKGANSLTTISALCEVDTHKDFPSTLPTLSADLDILCPPNSKIVTRR